MPALLSKDELTDLLYKGYTITREHRVAGVLWIVHEPSSEGGAKIIAYGFAETFRTAIFDARHAIDNL